MVRGFDLLGVVEFTAGANTVVNSLSKVIYNQSYAKVIELRANYPGVYRTNLRVNAYKFDNEGSISDIYAKLYKNGTAISEEINVQTWYDWYMDITLQKDDLLQVYAYCTDTSNNENQVYLNTYVAEYILQPILV